MPRPGRSLLLAASLALVLGLIWRSCKSEDAPEAQTKENSQKRAGSDRQRTRAHKDLNRLARALSTVAARTIGLVMVSGQVVDRGSGDAIPHAEVVFTGPSGESSVLCDDQGRYQVELMPGFYRSYAQAESYVAVAPAAAERLPGPVSAAAVAMPQEGIAPLLGLFRDQSGVVLSLSAAAVLRGRVVNTNGGAIVGAVVAGRGQGGLRVISGSDVSESDGGGHYELLVPTGVVQLEARHEDYAGLGSTRTAYVRAGEVQELDLVMTVGCIIEGWVVDSDGEPVASGSFERHIGNQIYTPVGEIDAGHVRFAMGMEGTVQLRAWPWKSPPSEAHEYRCSEGMHLRNETFVIPNTPPTLTGIVEDAEGQRVPLAFVDVFALEPGGSTQQERADVDGAFSFHALPKGPYQLSVYVPGKGAVIALSDVPSSGVPLRLGGTGSILGSVDGISTGSVTMRYRCAFQLDEEEAARSDALSMPMQTLLVPIEHGRFRINDLPACPLRGTVSGEGLHRNFAIEVEPRRETVLRIQ